jgi:hypothetical protein
MHEKGVGSIWEHALLLGNEEFFRFWRYAAANGRSGLPADPVAVR